MLYLDSESKTGSVVLTTDLFFFAGLKQYQNPNFLGRKTTKKQVWANPVVTSSFIATARQRKSKFGADSVVTSSFIATERQRKSKFGPGPL